MTSIVKIYLPPIKIVLTLIIIHFRVSSTTQSRWPSWSKALVSGTGPRGHGFSNLILDNKI